MAVKKANTNATTSEPVLNTPDFFENLGSKAIWVCFGLISLIAFFVFKDYLLQNKIFLFKDIGSDTLNGTLPYHYYMANYFAQNGVPTWSFAEGMGQSVFAGLTRDPFIIISYLFGTKYIPQCFIYLELSKLILGGVVFFMFLKTLKVSNFSAILGGVLFSFCGFMIIGACWYLFTYEALNVAMLLLGFELFYQRGKWFLFVLTIFLVAISMPFNLYIFGLFLAVYIAFRIMQDPTKTYKDLLIMYGKLILLGGAGLLLSGPFLLETMIQLLESPRGSGGNSYFDKLAGQSIFHLAEKEQFGASIMRLFSSDLLGSGNDYSINGVVENGQFVQKNWGNFLEAPLSYCGIISLILFPQVFGFVEKKKRTWYIVLAAFVILPTIFPYFRYAIWLFTGDYYRAYSFFISIVFILFSVYSLDIILKHRKINLMVLGGTLLLWLILEMYPYFKEYQRMAGGKQLVDETVSTVVKVLLLAYAALIFVLGKSKNVNNLKYVILAVVSFEAIYMAGLSVNRRNPILKRELTEKVGYNDYSKEAVAFIKSIEKSPFYRIDKSYYSSGAMHGSLNDHKYHGYYSTSSYNSWSQMHFINYMRSYGVINKDNEYESRWVPGLINKPFMESLNNVKYIMTKVTNNPMWKMSHDSLNKFGDVVVLKSKFDLPFGYTYDTYMTQSEFEKISMGLREFVSFSSCVIKDEEVANAPGLKHYNLADTMLARTFNWDTYRASLNNLRKDSLNITLFSEKKITGTANVSENKVMYLSFPWDKGWHLMVDGKEVEKLYLNCGMTGIYLAKGNHQIELNYELRLAGKGTYMSIGGIVFCGILFVFFRRLKPKESQENDNQ